VVRAGHELTNEDRIKAGRGSRIHGIFAVEGRGQVVADQMALEISQMSFVELRAGLRDPAVREAVRDELTARLAFIMEAGFSWLTKTADAGRDPFATPAAKRLPSYLALLERMLRSYPRAEQRDQMAQELARIRALMKDYEGEGPEPESESEADAADDRD